MKKYRKERNWLLYNQKKKKIARIDFYISESAIKNWHYVGKRSRGGKVVYSDHVIELCLIMREFYKFAYRQMQGFIEVETTMWQIKSYCCDRLTNKREDTRATQAKIKCKVINLINAA